MNTTPQLQKNTKKVETFDNIVGSYYYVLNGISKYQFFRVVKQAGNKVTLALCEKVESDNDGYRCKVEPGEEFPDKVTGTLDNVYGISCRRYGQLRGVCAEAQMFEKISKIEVI